MISAQMVCDSVSNLKIRLSTIELVYPRYIHAEFMTHRVFSRNSASSRAIPVATMLRAIHNHPVTPIEWGTNKRGMQAGEPLAGIKLWGAQKLWSLHRRLSTSIAWGLSKCDVHKQHVNRLTEAHQHMRVLVSSTDWANFLELREHPDAMPEIQQLAALIREELEGSTPRRVAEGNWHLPYIDTATCLDLEAYLGGDPRKIPDDTVVATLRLVSAARCARVSYTTIGTGSKGVLRAFEDDLALGRRLVESRPLHASPMEHQATPMAKVMRSSNFRGWVQYRKLLPGECAIELPYELGE